MSRQPSTLVRPMGYRGKKVSPLTTIISSGLLVVTAVACSREKADFSSAKVSAEAMEQFSSYEAVKDNPEFVKKLDKILAFKSDQKLEDLPATLTVKGVNFNDWRQSLSSTWKINKLAYDGTWANYLKKHKLDIRGVSLQDFQLAEDTMFDTMKVGGNSAALNALMKKYDREDFAKAVRANLVRAAFAQMSQAQESASLGLTAKESGDPFAAAASVFNNGVNARMNKPLIEANANATNSCTAIRNQCFEEGLDKKCPQYNFNPDAGGNPDHRRARQHDSGLVIEGISVTSPPIYSGAKECAAYKWKATCDEGYKKYKGDREGEYYHKDSSKDSCHWVFDHGPSGKADSVEAIAKQAAIQDATIKKCVALKDFSCTTNHSIGGFYQGSGS